MNTTNDPTSTTGRPKRVSRGFALLEVMAGLALLAVGLLSMAGATVSGTTAMLANDENARATQAAREAVESLENGDTDFNSLFAAYTTGVADEEAGTTSTPLARTWTVAGVTEEQTTDVKIEFPMVTGVDTTHLREDLAKQDLNGDGEIDSADHSGDYKLLPVTVTVSWNGRTGPRTLKIQTLLSRK